jgi:predicted HicB family RNase H-like nuclease
LPRDFCRLLGLGCPKQAFAKIAALSIPEPLGTRHYKGNITLRVPPDVHRNLAILSAEQGVSINQLVLSRL